jgi:hypothetical protein
MYVSQIKTNFGVTPIFLIHPSTRGVNFPNLEIPNLVACPNNTGRSATSANFWREAAIAEIWSVLRSCTKSKSGVTKIPTKFEKVPFKTAAGSSPPAARTKMTLVSKVVGRDPVMTIPRAKASGKEGRGRIEYMKPTMPYLEEG